MSRAPEARMSSRVTTVTIPGVSRAVMAFREATVTGVFNRASSSSSGEGNCGVWAARVMAMRERASLFMKSPTLGHPGSVWARGKSNHHCHLCL